MILNTSKAEVENYGIADLCNATTKPLKSVKFKGLVEKPSPDDTPSNLAILGCYILPNSVLNRLEKNGGRHWW